jgi:hypothetical protein
MGSENSAVHSLSILIVSRLVEIFWRRLVNLSISIPLACLTLAFLAPTPARAGCDYPTHVERTPINLADGSTSAATMPNHDSGMPSQPCPCKGPTCSRQPLAPSVPPSVESVRISEWGRLIPRFALASPQAETCVPDEPLKLPLQHPSLIFHPPRLPL